VNKGKTLAICLVYILCFGLFGVAHDLRAHERPRLSTVAMALVWPLTIPWVIGDAVAKIQADRATSTEEKAP